MVPGLTTFQFLSTPEAVANAVRGARSQQQLSQLQLAEKARVGRRFIIELESGHARAELGKVLRVLEALDIHATALPGPIVERPTISLKELIERFS